MLSRNHFVLISALALVASVGLAAEHTDVTPFDGLKTQLEMSQYEGYTLPGFVREVVKPKLDTYQKEIDDEAKAKPSQFSVWQTDLINEGAGVAIRLDDLNYLFNVGYGNGTHVTTDAKTGKTVNDDTKSGRSYGVHWNAQTGEKHESDPSYPAYFTELKALFADKSNIKPFYHVILEIITGCDASDLKSLSKAGQQTATDFVAIYIAERNRNVMVQESLQNHPWQIDHALTTLLSQAVTISGKMMTGSKIGRDNNGNWTDVTPGKLTNFDLPQWTQPGHTSGSGVGMTREDRIAYQHMFADKLASDQVAQKAVSDIESVTGQKVDSSKAHGGDALQLAFEFMNQEGSPAKLGGNKKRFEAALENYLAEIAKAAQDL